MVFIIQTLFLQKLKPLYPTPKYLFGTFIWEWDLNLDPKEFEIHSSCFRSTCPQLTQFPPWNSFKILQEF